MKKVLIVDDDEKNRELMKAILSSKFEILVAHDAIKGLEMVDVYHPDLIITDLNMPTMKGDSFTKELRKKPEFKDIPIIFYTASDFVADATLMAIGCGVSFENNY